MSVLIQGIGGVGRRPKIRSVRVATGFGVAPIANIVKSILKLLARNRAAIVPVVFSGGHLTECIVPIHPKAAVSQGHLGPLIRQVVLVGVGSGQLPSARRGIDDALEASQVIKLALGRHPGRRALFEGDRINERGVWNVRVIGRIGAIAHVRQA